MDSCIQFLYASSGKAVRNCDRKVICRSFRSLRKYRRHLLPRPYSPSASMEYSSSRNEFLPTCQLIVNDNFFAYQSPQLHHRLLPILLIDSLTQKFVVNASIKPNSPIDEMGVLLGCLSSKKTHAAIIH